MTTDIAPHEPLVRFHDVGKTFGRGKAQQEVLRGIDLDVRKGDVLAIIGPSGCGKSTLLNLLADLTTVTTGSIEITSDDLRTAYVFQNPRLLPWRTLRRNIEFALEQIEIGASERRTRAEAALRMVHLEEHMDKYPNQLSGGMQQRAALARGLAVQPTLLLLDEPLGALDALTRSYLQEELLRLIRRNRTTALLVTHDIDEALLLADHVVVMSSRPARIRRIFEVPFGQERDLDTILSDPRFSELRHEIRELLRPEMAATDPALADEQGGDAEAA